MEHQYISYQSKPKYQASMISAKKSCSILHNLAKYWNSFLSKYRFRKKKTLLIGGTIGPGKTTLTKWDNTNCYIIPKPWLVWKNAYLHCCVIWTFKTKHKNVICWNGLRLSTKQWRYGLTVSSTFTSHQRSPYNEFNNERDLAKIIPIYRISVKITWILWWLVAERKDNQSISHKWQSNKRSRVDDLKKMFKL